MLKDNIIVMSDDLSSLEDIYYGGISKNQQIRADVRNIMDDKYIYGQIEFEKMLFANSEQTEDFESLEFNLSDTDAKFELIYKDKSINTLQHTLMGSIGN